MNKDSLAAVSAAFINQPTARCLHGAAQQMDGLHGGSRGEASRGDGGGGGTLEQTIGGC